MFDRMRRHRSDVSLVTDVLAALTAARLPGQAVAPERLPVVVGITSLHADVLGAMPLETPEGTRPAALRTALDYPCIDEHRLYSTAKVVWSAMHTGNAYALRGDGAGRILDPQTVTPMYRADDPLDVASWLVAGRPVAKSDIVHLKVYDSPVGAGPLGRSPYNLASDALAMYGHAYAYLTQFFEGGGNPSSVLSATGPSALAYDPAQVAKDWIAARQERRPAVLPNGISLSVPANNGEMEAVARILEQGAAECARLTNTPPSLANARTSSSMTYSNVASELRRWMALALRPTWMSRIELFYSDLLDLDVVLDTDPLFDLVDATETAGVPASPPPLELVA